MNTITEAELKKHIKDKMFKRCYMIFGEDSFLKQTYAKKLSESAVEDMLPEMNFSKADGKGLKAQQLLEETDQLPVMAAKRCVLVTDFDAQATGETELKDIVGVIENLPETTVLIIYCDTVEINTKKPAKWKSVISAVDKKGCLVELNYKTESELSRTIIAAVQKRGSTIDSTAAKYLAAICGRDLQKIQGETDKLCSYKKDGAITKDDIDLLCSKTLTVTKYQLPKLLLAQNVPATLSLITDLLDMRLEPIEILGVIISVYVDIYRVKAAVSGGKTISEAAKEFGYFGREFVLNNAAPVAKRMSATDIRKCLDLLNDADKKLKLSLLDSQLVLEQTVILLVEIMRGRR